MRDKVLAYALAVSIGVHILVLCVVGKTSAARPIEVDSLNLVRVNVIKTPDEPKPVPEVSKPAPPLPQLEREHASVPPPERIPVAPPKKRPVTKPQPTPVKPIKSPVYSTSPVKGPVKLPGNPGGPLDLGTGSKNGQDLGGTGKTPVGWVPGPPSGTGTGSGKGPGVGTPEPIPGAVEGPGKEPAPPPPPPPPPDIDVRVCTESGMLPGPNCEHTAVRSFRPGRQPTAVCNVCKPKHVSTLADRSVPELISGRRAPKYPESARDRGVEGSVTVEYTINKDGNVVGVQVTSSSGSSDLDRAAVSAVESRKYKPAVQAGIPRNYRKRETFHFALD